MPPALIAALPIIAAITGIAGTGVGLGLELSNQPGSPKPPTPPPPAQTDAAANQQHQNLLAAVSQQLPNVQAATAGGLAPSSALNQADLLAGVVGAPGVGSVNTDLIMKMLTGNSGGGVSAGNNSSGGAPGTPGGLTNSTFG